MASASSTSLRDPRRSISQPSHTIARTTRPSASDVDNTSAESSQSRFGADPNELETRRRIPRRHASGGFLLDAALPGRPKSKSPAARHRSRRPYSRGSSTRSRPRSGNFDHGSPGQTASGLDIHTLGADEHEESAALPSAAAMDPAQIIRLALNLSESRRRNLSHGQLVAPAPPRSRRGTPLGLGIAGNNTPMQGSFHDHSFGGSIKQHLHQQRRTSADRSSTPASRRAFASSPNPHADNALGSPQHYTFSPATIYRADRAKTHVQLSAEYRRLLQHLPPLKTEGEPGCPYSLGREYNPLQFIRNRKLRARERRKLNPDVAEFEDVDQVRVWVDRVERAASRQNSQQGDKASVPLYEPDPGADAHRSSLFPGRHKRPRMDWLTLPTELLADAAWLEQESHKDLIEDRNGNRIFPPLRSTSIANPRRSRDQARPSLDKRRASTASSMAGGGPFSEGRSNYSSEAESYRGRKRRHFLHGHREDTPERGRRLAWMSRARSSSSSGLSSSDGAVSERRHTTDRRLIPQDENVGPLERHMKTLLEDDVCAENGLSPVLSSPDRHWSSGATGRYASGPRFASQADDEVDCKTGVRRATGRLVLLADDPVARPRLSMDGLDSSVPNTPLSKTFSLPVSSTSSRVASPDRSRSKISNLPFFRSESNTKPHRTGTSGHKRNSSEYEERGRLSSEQPVRSDSLPRPGLLKSHKTTDSLSSLTSIQEGRESSKRKEDGRKDASSAMGRFFKDVGREGSKAKKFIFKKDRPHESVNDESLFEDAGMPSASETEDDMAVRRPGADAACDMWDRPQGYALPTFKSAAVQDRKRDSSIASSEPRRGRDRSPRFERRAPPRLDTSLGGYSSPAGVHVQSERPSPLSRASSAAVGRRTTKKLSGPPDVIGLEPSHAPVERQHSNRSSPGSPWLQHHWSIADPDSQCSASAQPTPSNRGMLIDTRADIARIQALLLCSGIKAAELARRAHAVPDTPPAFLVRAVETVEPAAAASKHARLTPKVAAKEQHMLAAQLLADNLDAASAALTTALDGFRAQRVRALHARCERLRVELDDALTPRCHAAVDAADAATRELTSNATLAVKAVADRVDALSRARRRRVRRVRRVGWILLEWCVLGVMWWVWLVVVIVRACLAAVRAPMRGLKWFFWLDY